MCIIATVIKVFFLLINFYHLYLNKMIRRQGMRALCAVAVVLPNANRSEASDPSSLSRREFKFKSGELNNILGNCKGLLKGITNMKEAEYYSKEMNLREASNMLNTNTILIEAVKSDSKLTAVKSDKDTVGSGIGNVDIKPMQEWFERNELYDRDQLREAIAQVLNMKGGFVCVLGGKSTGKSFLFNNIAKTAHNNKSSAPTPDVVLVDMRYFPNVDGGLLSGLIKCLKEKRDNTFSGALHTHSDAVQKIGKASGRDLAAIVNTVKELHNAFDNFEVVLKDKSDLNKLKHYLEWYFKYAEVNNWIPTIVIDEANIALDKKKVNITYASDLLALFVQLTKQELKVSKFTFAFCMFIDIYLT